MFEHLLLAHGGILLVSRSTPPSPGLTARWCWGPAALIIHQSDWSDSQWVLLMGLSDPHLESACPAPWWSVTSIPLPTASPPTTLSFTAIGGHGSWGHERKCLKLLCLEVWKQNLEKCTRAPTHKRLRLSEQHGCPGRFRESSTV